MRKTQILLFGIMLLVGIAGGLRNADAYPNYEGSPACSSCHPGFIGKGTLHDLHVSAMTGTCTNCHVTTRDNPPLANCAKCHVGPGLRAHHKNAGVPADSNKLTCSSCHPSDPTPAPENIAPPYYTRTDVTVKDPCQAQPAPPGEDFNGDLVGLDNDGDLLYDTKDLDCPQPPTTTTVRPTTTTTSIRPTTTTTSIRPTTTTSVLPTTTTTSIRPTTTTSIIPTTTTTSVRPTTTTSVLPTTTSVRPTTTTSVLPTTTSVRPTTTTSVLPTTTSVRPTTTTSVLPTTTSVRPTTTTSVLPTTTTTSIIPTTTTTILNTTEDVSLTLLQAPRRISVKRSSNTTVQVVVEATGTTEQLATVSLAATFPAGINVQIDPASLTKELSDDGATRFIFNATIYGTQKGRWAVNWTATITAPQNSNVSNDIVTGTTQVTVINTLREAIMDLRAKILRR